MGQATLGKRWGQLVGEVPVDLDLSLGHLRKLVISHRVLGIKVSVSVVGAGELLEDGAIARGFWVDGKKMVDYEVIPGGVMFRYLNWVGTQNPEIRQQIQNSVARILGIPLS